MHARSTISVLVIAVLSVSVEADKQLGASKSQPLDKLIHRVDRLLKEMVDSNGLVHYTKAIESRCKLDSLIKHLALQRRFKTDAQKLALHINAYNLIVIQQVAANWPVKSVMAMEGFFDKTKHRINGRDLTLNDLENKVIRPMGDPRIHGALVCATMSCPLLRRGAYTPQKLGEQLERTTRRWIGDARKNGAKDGVLQISLIFKWYEKDFLAKPNKGVVHFILRHAQEGSPIARLCKDNPSPPVEYLGYDWTVNEASRP